ncbi:MAG TPA: hypothetical protein VF585_11640 [Chthoniobacterales bacterium]
MARLSQSLPCPACGESMKVSRATAAQKVCCPHCRQNVVLPASAARPDHGSAKCESQPDPVPGSPDAARQLEDALTICKEKRQLLARTQQEIDEIEMQARSLGQWLQSQEATPEDRGCMRPLFDLHARLFEQVRPLKRGHISIVDCDAGNEKTLAHFVRLTFEAFGWSVDFERGTRTSHCGEEVTFTVAPGPVSYPSAAIYMALQSSGIRLHSRIDLAQPPEHVLLCVHQVSKIPKVLPASKIAGLVNSAESSEELRKSA